MSWGHAAQRSSAPAQGGMYANQQYQYGSQYQNPQFNQFSGGSGTGPGYMSGPQAPPGVRPELWNWFVSVDQDGNGRITVEELQRALVNGNWSPFNEETCRLMVGMFDRDRSGTIDIHEFEALWKYVQDWKNCFDGFDRDRSGTIDAGELHNAFQTFGYRLTPGFSSLVIRKFDRQARNSINFDDFIQACIMMHILTNAFRTKDTTQTGTIQISYEQFLEMVMDTTIRT